MPKETAKQRMRKAIEKDPPRSRSPRRTSKSKGRMHAQLCPPASSSSKIPQEDDDDPGPVPDLMDTDDEEDTFRQNVTDLYLRNDLSAKKAARLIRSAAKSKCE